MRALALAVLVACGGAKAPPSDGTGGPAVTVTARYPGASPDQVEALLVTPLEQALVREPQIVTLRSLASPGEARVVMWFRPGTDERAAAQHARDSVAKARAQLPVEVESPTISIGDPDAPPDLAYVAGTSAMPAAEVSRLLERVVAPAVLTRSGVRRVEVTGAHRSELRVVIDADRVRATGVTHDEVIAALVAAGRFSPEEGGALVVAQLSHVPVLIRDLATLRVGASAPASPVPLGLAIWTHAAAERPAVDAALTEILRDVPHAVVLDPAPRLPARSSLAIELVGDDPAALEAVADSLVADLADVATVAREVPAAPDRMQQLVIDKDAARRLNVPGAAVAAIAAAFAHRPLPESREGPPVVVELGTVLDAILVRATDGAAIPLGMIATLETRPTTPVVHVNARRALVLTVALAPGGTTSDVQALLDRHPRIAHDGRSPDPRARLVTRKLPQ